jgi:hypothetical protein
MKTCVVALALLAGGSALAEERSVKESEVPPPVLDKAHKKYPRAKFTGFEREDENGKTSFEVKLTDGDKHIDVVCAPDGVILAEEELLAAESIPAPVMTAYRAMTKYRDWTFRKAERISLGEKTDAPTYAIKLEKESRRVALTFTAEGKLSKTVEKEWRGKK